MKKEKLFLSVLFHSCLLHGSINFFIIFSKLSPKGRSANRHKHSSYRKFLPAVALDCVYVCVRVRQTGCGRTEEPVVSAAALRNLHLIKQHHTGPTYTHTSTFFSGVAFYLSKLHCSKVLIHLILTATSYDTMTSRRSRVIVGLRI